MDRNSVEVVLGDGYKAIFYERNAYDVLTVVNLSMTKEGQTAVGAYYISARIIRDSLIHGLSYWKPKTWGLRKRCRAKWILKHHGQQKMNNLIETIYGLEGVDLKKKIKIEPDLKSGETLPDV